MTKILLKSRPVLVVLRGYYITITGITSQSRLLSQCWNKVRGPWHGWTNQCSLKFHASLKRLQFTLIQSSIPGNTMTATYQNFGTHRVDLIWVSVLHIQYQRKQSSVRPASANHDPGSHWTPDTEAHVRVYLKNRWPSYLVKYFSCYKYFMYHRRHQTQTYQSYSSRLSACSHTKCSSDGELFKA